jgi:hypothetical protein
MSPDRLNVLLKAAAAAMACAAPLVAAAGLLLPLDATGVPRRVRAAATKPAGASAAVVVPAESFGPALTRTLRPSLAGVAAAPVEATPAAAPTVGLERLTLVGTVGNAVAMIQGPGGRVALVEVGDDVEGAHVVSIRERLVELRQDGRIIRLEKPLPAAGAKIDVR